MSNITFAHPWLLLGLLLAPVMVVYYLWRYRKQEAAVQHSDIEVFTGIRKTLRVRLRWLPYALRVVAEQVADGDIGRAPHGLAGFAGYMFTQEERGSLVGEHHGYV